MEWRQWSAEDNMYYSLKEIFEGEEQSAFQVSGPTSLSVDHAASQLLAPCTHHRQCNLDHMFYPDSFLPLSITIPSEFAETEEFRDVCFTCFKEYEQNNPNGPRENINSICRFKRACRHYRNCINARIEPESNNIPPKPKCQAQKIIKEIKRSNDDTARTAADIIGIDGFEAILKENQYGFGPKEPGDFHVNSIVAGAI